jgi:hypothetical protein
VSPSRPHGAAAEKRLFHRDGFDGALAHACAAIDALALVHDGLAILHRDGLDGARSHASLATGAGVWIHFRWHFPSPFLCFHWFHFLRRRPNPDAASETSKANGKSEYSLRFENVNPVSARKKLRR